MTGSGGKGTTSMCDEKTTSDGITTDGREPGKGTHRLVIRAIITKTATVTVDVPEDELEDVRLDPHCVIGSSIDAAFDAADEQHEDVSYDYQIRDASNGYGIIVDFDYDD